MRLCWSPRSIADLEAIRSYISLDSPFYADLVVRRITHAVERLEHFPDSGRVVPEVGDERLREVIVRPYRVAYRVHRGAVEIVTIFHAARFFPGIS